jgi:GDPmannose 4,6-dehydratase
VIATGETHSVKEFVEEAFACLDLDWRQYVVVDACFFRPAEVDVLMGDASKARARLGWKPRTSFKDLVRLMIESDMVEAEIIRAGIR